MDEQRKTDIAVTEDENRTETVNAPAEVKPRRKRLIKTISRRMMLNYFLFAAAILLLLWAAFFFGMFNFYSTIVKDDIRKVGEATAAAFPKRADDKSMTTFFRGRLSDTAKTNAVSVLVYERTSDGITIIMAVDGMGNSSTDGEGIENAKDIINLIKVEEHDHTGYMESEYGAFVYYASEHEVEMESVGHRTLEMLILKPYYIFNYQTNKIILILIACTVFVLILACICAYIASRVQTKCLTDFTKKAERVASGDYDVKYEGYGYYEYDVLANALNDATESVKSTEKLQRDFIANVSHDIRTPITIIRAYAEMIRDLPQDDEKRKKTADTIITEADRLTTLTNDVLNYSRLSSGVIEFNFEPCDISAMAHSVISRFDLYKTRDGMNFIAEIDDGVTVNCDKDHLQQVFYNLISNACNYCGEDKTVIVRVKNNDGVARVEVEDHGKGIAPEDIDAIWSRYYRAAHAKRNTVGSGLGLSICNNILKAHNARFGVLSELGSGSTFWFELDAVKSKNAGGGAL